MEVKGDSKIIPAKFLFCAVSIATAVPRDSPYKMRFFSLTPFDFNQSSELFASSYRPSSLGLPDYY